MEYYSFQGIILKKISIDKININIHNIIISHRIKKRKILNIREARYYRMFDDLDDRYPSDVYIYILSTIFHVTSRTQPETKMDIPIRILDKNRGKSPPIFPHSSYPQFLFLCARTLLDSPLDASSKRHRCVRETGRAFLSARIQGD